MTKFIEKMMLSKHDFEIMEAQATQLKSKLKIAIIEAEDHQVEQDFIEILDFVLDDLRDLHIHIQKSKQWFIESIEKKNNDRKTKK